MIFPNEINIPEVELNNNELKMYKEVAWDFKNNEPLIINGDPVIVEGREAIKVWCYKALLTNRFKHTIFSWDYGCEIETLINKGFTKALMSSEVERFVIEALEINEYITKVEVDNISFQSDSLSIYITVNTVYGEVVVNV